MHPDANIEKIKRHFIPEEFKIDSWDDLKPYFEALASRSIDSKADLEKWLHDLSELDAVVSEDFCWRQIKMTCNTEDETIKQSFINFASNIQPEIQVYANQFNKKLVENPYLKELDQKVYFTYLRNVKKSIDLFKEENVPLQTSLSVKQQEYGAITGSLTIELNGQEYTLQQAAKFLESEDRSLREQVYRKVQEARLSVHEKLDQLLNELIELRHQVAKNAGFENYVQFKFKELGRFDYDAEDCFHFHEAVKTSVMPLVNMLYRKKKEALGIDSLKPWDLDALPAGMSPLKPFENGEDLLHKTILCFQKIKPFFADCLRRMKSLNHFDLDSRKGKAPGGYNCPLAESGAPFIFMNAAGQMSDVITMVHEGGHAVHSFLAHPLPLSSFKEYPMEIAEVASMAMELFSMDYWDVFFKEESELKRAKLYQFERVITIFPWIATIDKFQHWLYNHPFHSIAERKEAWLNIMNEFTSPEIDTSGLENYRAYGWQKQLHIFEVPFYYIEYGIAQLGAIGLYKQFKSNKEEAIKNYMYALKLGNTKTLPDLYEAAGLKFDFSSEHISKLMKFIHNEIELLEKH